MHLRAIATHLSEIDTIHIKIKTTNTQLDELRIFCPQDTREQEDYKEKIINDLKNEIYE